MARTCETIKITKRTVDAATPLLEPGTAPRQRLYLDTALRGFGLCVGATAKTYFAQRTVRGRSVRVTIGRHGEFTVDQARREAQQLLAKMARGLDPVEEKRKARARGFTLSQALDLCVERLKSKGRSASTIDGYRYSIETYLKDWLTRPLAEITRQDVRLRHQKIAADVAAGRFAKGRPRTKEHGARTANSALVAFRAVYNAAAREHPELPSGPTLSVNWFKSERPEALPLSELHTWAAKVTALDNPIRRDFLFFTSHTGLRRTSAVTARWGDINFERRVLHVPNPKGGKAFDLPLTDFLVELLRTRKKDNAEVFEDSPWIFPALSESGHISEPREEFVGIDWKIHDLRRWFITAAESLDLSPYVIKALANHALPSGDVTAGYIQHEVERLRPAMEAIGERLRAACLPSDAKVVQLPRVVSKAAA